MKSRIFMYLFVFSVLLIIFQFVNSKNILDSYEIDIKKEKERVANLKAEVKRLKEENSEMKVFDIEYDDDALDYFEDQGFNSRELVPKIKEELYKLNVYEGGEHPIVPIVSNTKGKMLIDSIRLLNHKWLIANFTDGKNRGQMFLTYDIVDGKKFNFKVEHSFLYPIQ